MPLSIKKSFIQDADIIKSQFLPQDADTMHKHMYAIVHCPSVCLWHWSIILKWLNLTSSNQHT